jgi:hypothetical protein
LALQSRCKYWDYWLLHRICPKTIIMTSDIDFHCSKYVEHGFLHIDATWSCILWCSFGFRHHVDWLVGASILETYAVSIFMAEVMSWDSEALYRLAGGEGPIRTEWGRGWVGPMRRFQTGINQRGG